MKQRKLTWIFCILSCVLLMTGCDLSLTKQNKNFSEKKLKKNAEAAIDEWFAADYSAQIDQYQQAIDYYDSMKDQFSDEDWESYQKQRAEWKAQIKEFKQDSKLQNKYGKEKKKIVGKPSYTISSKLATVNMTVQTEKGKKIVFSVSYDEAGSQTELKVDEYKTLGQKMGKAGLNTFMSMAIVFAVLIFISLVIKCFKFIGVIGAAQKPQTKTASTASEAPAATPAQASAGAEENLVDDLELVAVITAAIAAASETESADGLVVRSIVRRA